MGHLQFALSDYQQALELDPSNWEVYCRVAVVCCEIGIELFRKAHYSNAEQLFSAAIQHNPKVSWFYICRARVNYELKVYRQCYSVFTKWHFFFPSFCCSCLEYSWV